MASDYLLEITGIKGESSDKKHPDTIEVSSFSWGVSNAGAHAGGSGGGAGKASFQDLHFTSAVGIQSAKLMLACASGEHIKKAVLYVRKSGKDQVDYYKVTLEDLLVSSYQSGGHEGSNAIPTDQFSLNFTKVKFEYTPQKSDGTLGSAIVGSWNVKTNTPT